MTCKKKKAWKMTRNVTFLKLHSSLLFASLKSVVCPTAPGSSSKLTLKHFHTTYISNYNTAIIYPQGKMNKKHDMLTFTVQLQKVLLKILDNIPLTFVNCFVKIYHMQCKSLDLIAQGFKRVLDTKAFDSSNIDIMVP